ncbi:MAG: DNA polymerase III subunit epsilon [Gammaproteobacteria bacterium]|nr:MAG: DNA polymerase III subunit epsilon [Gammaproteobacteria bacterium]
MRQVVLDTETTGLETSRGHRIIEIGCVELVDRRLTRHSYHQYINPQRPVDEEAYQVHQIGNDFLADKPVFAEVADEFLQFIEGAELIIHNAAFDVGFIDYEFSLLGGRLKRVSDYCSVLDTLTYARKKHPGQKNNLDALCLRYGIDNSHRELHGALLDAEILADVYLAMTGGQTSLMLDASDEADGEASASIVRLPERRARLKVIRANEEELKAHESKLDAIDSVSKGSIWRQ